MIYIKIMNGKQVIKQLKKSGFEIVRISGSHHVMKKESCTVVVPVHGSKDLKKGLIKSIEKQSGVKLL